MNLNLNENGRRSISSKAGRWLLASIALVFMASLVVWNWQALTIWYTMVPGTKPLPEFDASKAQHLSMERRAALERELFSEVRMWNAWSRRYQAPNGLAERRQRWIDMANEGYELAHLTLQVLEPDDHVRNPLPALKRLDDLARQGDAGAMCLYGEIAFQLPSYAVDWTPQHKRGREWMIKGAGLGHPQCLVRVGGWTMSGYLPPKDLKRGSEMIFEALRAGYIHGASALRIFFVSAGLDKYPNRQLEYCWSFHAAKISINDADLTLKVYAFNDAPPIERSALEFELNKLRQWSPSIDECISLTRKNFGE